jgi:hypothetical protein
MNTRTVKDIGLGIGSTGNTAFKSVRVRGTLARSPDVLSVVLKFVFAITEIIDG